MLPGAEIQIYILRARHIIDSSIDRYSVLPQQDMTSPIHHLTHSPHSYRPPF